MTTTEAATALNTTPAAIRKLIERGRLPARRVDSGRGLVWKIKPSDVAAFKRSPAGRPPKENTK